MDTPDARPGLPRWARARDLAGLIVAWSVWCALTASLLLYVRHNSRNIPFMDEFVMVPVMTGTQPVSLGWAWAQHNEHRPLVSRLILAGLTRFVSNDFRTLRYANAVLLSAMAAAMLLLARRLRGSARLTDAALPLSILNIAQAESLMIGFAMNLILTSGIALALIALATLARRPEGTRLAIGFGLAMVVLPLCGGSGLAMLPPLVAWLAGYAGWGWWSGRKQGVSNRVIGAGLLLASLAIAALYLYGYNRPAHHPLPPSAATVASSILMYLSLAVYPCLSPDRWLAEVILLALLLATLLVLAFASLRRPEERPRALALLAIIVSMLAVAGAVGVSRAGFGPPAILASRYVTLTVPLLCVLYLAWLLYGNARARSAVSLGLLVMIAMALPDASSFGRNYGRHVRTCELRVERSLKDRDPWERLMSRACPAIYPHAEEAAAYFRMLRAARIGPFAELGEARIAAAAEPSGATRR
jgi:hypothetical protein